MNGYFYYRFSHDTSLSGLQRRHIQQLIHKNHMCLFYKLHILYFLYNIITSINEIIITYWNNGMHKSDLYVKTPTIWVSRMCL